MPFFKYKISFAVNGASKLQKVRAAGGSKVFVSELPIPTKDGFIFDAWCTDAALSDEVSDFVMPNRNVELFSRWVEETKPTVRAKFMPRARFDFQLKLSLSDDKIKSFYSDVRNAFRLYGARAYTSGKREHYKNDTRLFGRFTFKNKSLLLCLPLDLDDPRFDRSVFAPIYMGDVAACRDVPYGFKVGSRRSLPLALKLIDGVASDMGVSKKDIKTVDYTRLFPDVASGTVRLGYGHLIKQAVTLEEVRAIDDRWTDIVTEIGTTVSVAKNLFTVSVGRLAAYYPANAEINLSTLKARGLAGGCDGLFIVEDNVLSKPLTVVADGFSPDAVKQLCLSGGRAIKQGSEW